MTVLITGGAGFIGSHVAENLVSQGEKTVVLDCFSDYYSPKQKKQNLAGLVGGKNFVLAEGDIRDKPLVEKLFAKHKIDRVVHLAAIAGVRYSVDFPDLCYDINLNGTVNLLEASRKNKVKQFVFASSSSLYGNQGHFPTVETDDTNHPLSPYGGSKRAGEVLGWDYHVNFGLPITCLRFFTVYGPRNRPDMAVGRFGDAIAKGKPLPVFGDGKSKRDYTFVKDVANAIGMALDKDLGFEAINIGNSSPVVLLDLVSELENALGKKAKLEFKPWPAADPLVTYADVSKAKKLLDWKPTTSIREGIEAFADWYRSENNKLG